MNRSQYLAQRDVQQFIEWLVPHLTDEGSLSHGFVDRRSGRQWQFAGLEDACASTGKYPSVTKDSCRKDNK